MMKPAISTPARIILPRVPAVEEAERAGFDLSLIESNLNLTYEQRIDAHDSALALMLEFGRNYERANSLKD